MTKENGFVKEYYTGRKDQFDVDYALFREAAIRIVSPRWGGNSQEENYNLPAVQKLLRRGKNSKHGVSFVIIGTILLVLALSI